jgi:hypothetical protein
LELWELDENNQFVPGIDRALQIWDFQHKLCNTQQLKYQSANLQEQAVVNRKIFEPDQTVLGLRNEMKDMSGWVLVSNKEDLRDPSNSENMYLYEVFLQRPQLVHFLGLPTGSIFRLNDKGYNVTKPRVNS